jgi:hypothetical protein
VGVCVCVSVSVCVRCTIVRPLVIWNRVELSLPRWCSVIDIGLSSQTSG